jgi:tRNA threonylcarbamoyladenosine biosynthesis protein TsaB
VTPRGPLVLAIEASTADASVAVVRGDAVLAERRAVMRAGADDALMPAIDAALGAAGVSPRELAAVACGAGPGGFTSLRIAAAIAKGVAHATGCALVAVPSLALAAASRAAAGPDGPADWLATLDALRGERYAARVTTVRGSDGRVGVSAYAYLGVLSGDALATARGSGGAHVDVNAEPPTAAAVRAFVLRDAADAARGPSEVEGGGLAVLPVDLATWEPDYGRQAEAQARWELAHGRALATVAGPGERLAPDAGPLARDRGRSDARVG